MKKQIKLDSNQVQLWTKSGVMLGLIPREEAEKLIREGKAKAFTGQSIQFVK